MLLARNPWLLSFLLAQLKRRMAGLRPDRYVVSYPKSGRTWLRMMLLCYYSDAESLLDVDYSVLDKLSGRTVRFQHGPGNWRPLPTRTERLRIASRYRGSHVILLVRDPRDVLVSNWYHLTFRYRIYRRDLSHFIRDRHLGLDKVIAFMNLWTSQQDTLSQFHVLRYEDMRANPVRAVRSMLEHLGGPIDEARLQRAIELCSFDRMHRMESLGAHNPFAVPVDPKDPRTFKSRAGHVGDWKTRFEETDADYLNTHIANRLDPAFGY